MPIRKTHCQKYNKNINILLIKIKFSVQYFIKTRMFKVKFIFYEINFSISKSMSYEDALILGTLTGYINKN